MLSQSKRTAKLRLDEKFKQLQPFTDLTPPPKGWLRAIRDSLGMSGIQFARRLGVSWQSMDDLEKSEAAGTIGLETLRRAAAALDCTVVYAVIPNRSLEALVEGRARSRAIATLGRIDQTMLLEDQRVTDADKEELVEDYIRTHIRDRDLWDDQ